MILSLPTMLSQHLTSIRIHVKKLCNHLGRLDQGPHAGAFHGSSGTEASFAGISQHVSVSSWIGSAVQCRTVLVVLVRVIQCGLPLVLFGTCRLRIFDASRIVFVFKITVCARFRTCDSSIVF